MPVSAGQKVVDSRRVNKIKTDKLFKCHLVVLGWAQVLGIDCVGTFSPVCDHKAPASCWSLRPSTTTRLSCLTWKQRLQMTTTRRRSTSRRPLSTSPTTRPKPPPCRSSERVIPVSCRAPTLDLVLCLDDHLSNIVFHSPTQIVSVRLRVRNLDQYRHPGYVDCILLLRNDKQLLDKLKKQVAGHFEIKYLGDVSRVLVVNVIQNRKNGRITIDQMDNK